MENLGIDIKLLVAQIVSFVLFYVIFRRFVASPLLKYLQKQKEEEELRAKLATELQERQAQLEEKDREMDHKRKKALDEAIAQGKVEAELVKQGLIADAKKEAADLIAKTKAQLAEEQEKLYTEMREKIAGVSMLLVEKALRDYLTPDAQKIITKHIIEQVPKTKIEN